VNVFSTAHAAGQNSFHFVWKLKYVFSILIGDVKTQCGEVLEKIAQDYGYVIHALEVMPDHIHVFLSFKPSISVSEVFHKLDGLSGKRLFDVFLQLRKRYLGGHLWSRGKFFRSVGSTTDRAVKHYIEYSQGSWQHVEPQQEQFPAGQTQITRYLR